MDGWLRGLLCLVAIVLLGPGRTGSARAQAAVRPVTSAPTLGAFSLRQGDLPDALKEKRRIVVLPVRNNEVKVRDLFSPQVPAERAEQVAVLDKQVVAALAADPWVQVLGPEQVRAIFADDHGVATVSRQAQQWYRLGLEHYLSMAPQRAADTFRKAIALYGEVFQDLLDAKAFADASFMLGVALVDAGDAVAGHVALKRAFAMQPDRRFRPRFFSPSVERALSAALTDHLSTGNLARPYGDKARLHELSRRLDADALVTTALVSAADGRARLTVAVYRPEKRTIEAETSMELAEIDEKLAPFLRRWLECLPIESARAAPDGSGRIRNIWMDTSFSYAQYQRHASIREAFHSLGFAAGVSQTVYPGLEWFGRVNLYTSLSDPYRDLLYSFNSVRALAGLGFAIKRGPVRLFARPGLDVHLLGSFLATRDEWCKAGGEGHPLCKGPITDLEQDVLFGVNLALGTQIHSGRRFFFVLQVSASAYFLPLSGTDKLNYPVSGELGMGYRF